MDAGYQEMRRDLSGELLKRIKSSSPLFFEHLVVELLVAMGYGGSRQDAGEAVGRSGDGGVDGIIKEDRLGLDAILSAGQEMGGNCWQAGGAGLRREPGGT